MDMNKEGKLVQYGTPVPDLAKLSPDASGWHYDIVHPSNISILTRDKWEVFVTPI